jgi:hypothetical protein
MVDTQSLVLGILIVVLALGVFYLVDPSLGGLVPALKKLLGLEGFDAMNTPADNMTNGYASAGMGPENAATVKNNANVVGGNNSSNNTQVGNSMLASAPTAPAVPAAGSGSPSNNTVAEGFMSLSPSPMPFPGGEPPSNCYPTNQLKAQDLLPSDPNSKWAAVNPMGAGDISGKNFLSAGALIGVNTVGQSLRNANHDLRSDPPNPQVVVSPWMQTTIQSDLLRRPLE